MSDPTISSILSVENFMASYISQLSFKVSILFWDVSHLSRCSRPLSTNDSDPIPDTMLTASVTHDPVSTADSLSAPSTPVPSPRPHPHPSFRQHFSDKCLPKHRFLEVHCSDFIADLGFEMAKLGESGIELAHQTMMQAEKCASLLPCK